MNNNPFTSLLYSKSRSLYRKKSETILTIAFFAMVLLLINLLTAHAQFTSGRIVVLQVGDGSGALSNASTALYLKEFTTTGSPGILVSIPSTGSTALTSSGTATSEGGISLSGDGEYIVIPGYNAAAGIAGIAGSSSATNPRAAGKVDYNASYNLAHTTTGFNNNNIRGAAGNGTNIWASGANDGIRYLGSGAPVIVSSTTTNNRYIQVINGNLYYSTGSGATRGIYQVGTGLPTSATTATNIINTGGASSNFGFAINSAGTIAYIADDASGISRYNFSGGIWSLAYVVNATPARGLCVDFSGTNPVLYATTTTASANSIIKITDTGAGSSSSVIATAPANTVFRGICFAPSVTGGVATKLAVTSVNGGISPSVNTPFSVTVQSHDASNVPTNVTANTNISLSLNSGSGSLSGTLTGTILAGTNQVVISGVLYDVAEGGVSITATRTSGDVLTPGTSANFSVLDAASQLAFVGFPSFNFTNNILPAFTVEARRPDNTVDPNYSGNVTLTLFSGSGTVSGTLTKPCVAGVATFNDISFTAPGVKTLQASGGTLSSAVSSSITISTATLTETIFPQYIQGINGTNNNRVPVAYRLSVSGLQPSTTYRYVNQVDTIPTGTNNGAGNCIFIHPLFFYRTTGASLATSGNYGELTTDASGNYSGWFITEPTGNIRFTPGRDLYVKLTLNDGAGGTTPFLRLATTQTMKVVNFGSGINDGTGLRGNSNALPRNFVFAYDNTAGTGRPIAGSYVELDGSDNNNTPYALWYDNLVNDVDGAYGFIIPNNLPNGIRRIEQRDFTTGNMVGCAAEDADGVWPSTANTVNPSSGLTPVAITSGDASLDPAAVPPTAVISGSGNLCLGGSGTVTLNFTGASPWNYSISGSGGPVNGTTSNNPENVSVTPLAGGIQNYTMASVSDANCPSGSGSGTATFTVSTAPPASTVSSVNSPSSACNGTVSLITTNAVSGQNIQYSWNTGTSSSTVLFSNNIGGPFTVGPFVTNTNQVYAQFGSLATSSSGYNICVQGLNGCGTTNNKCNFTRGTVSTPVGITGSSIQCSGAIGQLYSVTGPAPAGVETYVWSFSVGGAVITSLDPPLNSQVSIDFPAFSTGTLSVQAGLLCLGSSLSPARNLALSNATLTPAVPTGPVKVCPGNSYNYSVPAVAGATTYNWTVPANATITGGAGTNSITVQFNSTPINFVNAIISVNTTSTCGAISGTTSKTTSSMVPGTPSVISGQTSGVCDAPYNYSVTAVSGVTYNWSLPSGASGSSSSNIINVTFSNSYVSGTISVTGTAAGCAVASNPRSLNVSGAPATPASITALFPPCNGGPG
ncbi:MAG: hypothetical protein JNL47_11810, partial [Bacteroidia bacterium]|nr:hypothetical protein [Bacteroidia bacterium]